MSANVSRAETLLFQSSRLVAVGLIVLLVIAMALLGVSYFKPAPGVESVTYADVERAWAGRAADFLTTKTDSPPIPENVSRVIMTSGGMFMGWMNALEPDERAHFLQNLSAVIAETEAKKTYETPSVVNKFQEMYFERRAARTVSPLAASEQRAILTGQILLMAGLVGLFIVVLVLLAIERHLRAPCDHAVPIRQDA